MCWQAPNDIYVKEGYNIFGINNTIYWNREFCEYRNAIDDAENNWFYDVYLNDPLYSEMSIDKGRGITEDNTINLSTKIKSKINIKNIMIIAVVLFAGYLLIKHFKK